MPSGIPAIAGRGFRCGDAKTQRNGEVRSLFASASLRFMQSEQCTPCPAEESPIAGLAGAAQAGAPNRQASNPCDLPSPAEPTPPKRMRRLEAGFAKAGGAHAQRRDRSSDLEPSDRKTCETTLRKRLNRPHEQVHCRSLAAAALSQTYPRCQRPHRKVYEQNTNMSIHPSAHPRVRVPAQRLRPSKGMILRVAGSTPSRQRTLTAAMALPAGSVPKPNGAQPQAGQK